MTLIPADAQGGALAVALLQDMNDLTFDRHGHLALDNMRRNLAFRDRGQSLSALRKRQVGNGNSAVVVAAGPSIRRHDPIKQLVTAGYKGAVIATDSAVLYCLRNGLVPDLVLTLDPHATRIVRWFGDPTLTREHISADDYFGRQDMDIAFADELKTNDEVLGLLDRHGKDMKIALSTSASQAVVDRVLDTGMEVFWWNPMLDDPDQEGSVTAEIQRMNRLPSVNAGGNVGAAAWMMAHAVLGKTEVALTGMDFSYYGDTPYTATQYYHEARALVGDERLDEVFPRFHNPYLGAWFYTDPAYLWFRQCFLEMVQDAECRTCNCTQGGILYGPGIDFIPLAQFLSEHS